MLKCSFAKANTQCMSLNHGQDRTGYVWSYGWFAPFRQWTSRLSPQARRGDGLWCASLQERGLWNSSNCADEKPFVCEYSFSECHSGNTWLRFGTRF